MRSIIYVYVRDCIMIKERSGLILVLFLLFQLPLCAFFSKKGTFDELKNTIVVSELALIAISILSVSLVRQRPVRQVVSKKQLAVEAAPPVDDILIMEKQRMRYEKELEELRQEKRVLENRNAQLENDLATTKEEIQKWQVHFPPEIFLFLQKSIQVIGKALFTQIEDMQELRRQHMIEMRALLKKEPVGSFDKKTVITSVPRGMEDPLVLLVLLVVFSEKISNVSEGKGDVRSLVRRKFFDELRAVRNLPCLCVSLNTPSETCIPQSYNADDAKRIADCIRSKVIETNTICAVHSQEERWFVVRLSKPFFDDVFLCLKSA